MNHEPRAKFPSAQRLLCCATMLALAVSATRTNAATVYYLDLVNHASSDVVAFDVARAGSDRFHPLLRDGAILRGHGATSTVAVRLGDDGCRRDVRVRFADGTARAFRDFDVCANRLGNAVDPTRVVDITATSGEPAG